MQLKVVRIEYLKDKTIGKLYIDGLYVCDTLEDTDRGLSSIDSILYIKSKKVFAKTAIPKGVYEVVVTMSSRFKKMMPLLLNVKGFSGIRIHSGNTEAHTEGCILVGEVGADKTLWYSRIAFNKLMDKLSKVPTTEKIEITIC